MNARPGYKQTEIGEIPKEWQVVRLNQVCRVRRGASPRPIDDPSFFSAEGRGWIRIVDVTSTYKYLRKTTQYLSQKGVSRSVQVDPGDLIMSICATIGKPVILDMEACIHDGFVVFSELHANTDSEYLFYVLQSKESEFVGKKQTGTQGNLNTTIVGKTAFALPSLSEQQRIVSILSTCDDTIQKTDEIIAKSQQLKKGLMQQLLTKGLGHNKFRQTRIGEMPEEWSLSSLSQVCRIIDCKHRTPKYSDEGYPVVRPGDLKPRSLSLDACLRTTSEEYADLTSNYAPKRGDIAFSRNASFGVASYVTTDEEFAIGQDVVIVTSDSNSTLFYFYVLNSSIIDRQLKKLSTGSTFKRINLEEIRELEVPSPPMSEQEQIAAILSDVDRKIEKENYRKQRLGELKKGLIQVLLTGKVRVKVN